MAVDADNAPDKLRIKIRTGNTRDNRKNAFSH